MSKPPRVPRPAIDPKDNASNQQNANPGSPGTNRQYDQVHGNRSKQLDSSRKPAGKHKHNP